MSPYRVVVKPAGQDDFIIMQAMYYRNKHTGKRGILILRRVMPEISGPLTLEQMIQESYVAVTESNSLVENGYTLERDTSFAQKYAIVHTPHYTDSSRYVLADRHNLISECQRDCMIDHLKRQSYALIKVI